MSLTRRSLAALAAAVLAPMAAAPALAQQVTLKAVNAFQEGTYYARNFEAFVTALRAGRRPDLDALEGRKAVAIVAACYESARTGRPVKIEDPS